MSRKTVSLVRMIRRANHAMSAPDQTFLTKEENRGYRLGVATMLSTALHEANCYAGYSYSEPGPYVQGRTDESRRRYLIHASLQADYRALVADDAAPLVPSDSAI